MAGLNAPTPDFLKGLGIRKNDTISANDAGGVYRILAFYGEAMTRAMKANLQAKNKDASGSLSASIQWEVKIIGTRYVFQIAMDDYWYWVDKGRKASDKMPPIKAFKGSGGWIANKGLNIKAQAKARLGVRRGKLAATTKRLNEQVAWAIAKSLTKKNIPPSNFYSDVVNPVTMDKIKKAIEDEIGKQITFEIVESAKAA